jgi:hypothetical protein
MFGYVKPVSADLLVKEYEFYKATYCGICRAMKKHTGALSNVTLSYDSVFLAMVRMIYVPDSAFKTDKRRCIAHPMKKRPMLRENEAIEYTARAFALFAYYKLRDDMADDGATKRILVTPALPILKGGAKRAGIGELAKLMGEKLDAISALEREKCASIDEPAHLFGEILGAVFSHGFSGADRTVLYQCGYHLGKFIYAADAADDYEKDRKKGKYNPYVLAYGGAPLTDENKQSIKLALILECQKIEQAVDFMPFGTRTTLENIIKNVIYRGLVDRISFLDPKKENSSDKEK